MGQGCSGTPTTGQGALAVNLFIVLGFMSVILLLFVLLYGVVAALDQIPAIHRLIERWWDVER